MRNLNILTAAAALLLTVMVGAQEVELNPRHPDRYVVQKGDTLWDIAERFLKDPWHWPEIWHHNQQIENPHLIYPGDVLSLVYVDGEPRLTLARRTVKLSPTVRREEHPRPIPVVPLHLIEPFMYSPWVVQETEFEAMPYVVALEQDMIVASAPQLVYVRNAGHLRQGDRLTLVRKANVYRDGLVPPEAVYRERRKPDRRTEGDTRFVFTDPDRPPQNWNHDPWFEGFGGDLAILGYELIQIGEAHVERAGDPASVRIDRSLVEITAGDRIIPYSEYDYDAFYYPREPGFPVDARVIGMLGPKNEVVGQYDTVVINKGSRDGIQHGFVLDAWVPGREVKDTVAYPPGERLPWKSKAMVQLPPEYAGRILVYRTFDKVSYAIVVEAAKEVRRAYLVTNPGTTWKDDVRLGELPTADVGP